MVSGRGKRQKAASKFFLGAVPVVASGFLPSRPAHRPARSDTCRIRLARGKERMVFDTLKSRADFLRVRKGRHCRTPSLILQAAAQQGDNVGVGGKESQPPRFGYTVTKHVGSAVVRNLVRRRLKEAVYLLGPLHARPGFDYVLIARHGTQRIGFACIVEDLQLAFQKIHHSKDVPERLQQRRYNAGP